MGREIEQRCRRIFTYKLGRCGVCDGISAVLLFLSVFPPKQNLPYDAFGLKDQLLREIKRKKVWGQGGIKREGQQFDNSTMKGHTPRVCAITSASASTSTTTPRLRSPKNASRISSWPTYGT